MSTPIVFLPHINIIEDNIDHINRQLCLNRQHITASQVDLFIIEIEFITTQLEQHYNMRLEQLAIADQNVICATQEIDRIMSQEQQQPNINVQLNTENGQHIITIINTL